MQVHAFPLSSLSCWTPPKTVATALGMIPIPFVESFGSKSRSIPVMVYVFPEEVWPYARTVQLKP